jgi:hypothetical protein
LKTKALPARWTTTTPPLRAVSWRRLRRRRTTTTTTTPPLRAVIVLGDEDERSAAADAPTAADAPAAADAPTRYATGRDAMRLSIWSDDEHDSDEDVAAPVLEFDSDDVARKEAEDRENELKSEFNIKFKNYRKASGNIDWVAKCPELELSEDFTPDMLMKADMGKIMKEEFMDKDKGGSQFGFFPVMAAVSKGSIGSLMAASFASGLIRRRASALRRETRC